jgi:predicted transcriptional regulator
VTTPNVTIKSSSRDTLSVTELFHRLNNVMPQDQQIVAVAPELPVVDALKKMEKHHFSQLPVVVGRAVLGMFSYRSFSNAVIAHSEKATKNQKFNPLELLVEDCLEKATFARVTDEFVDWFEYIDQHSAVLVGEPNRLQGIVTAMDILRYLYGVASPFVLITEIELGLRALMQLAVDADTLATCARECLKDKYQDELPTTLEDMTFNDYVQIVGDGRSWDHFQLIMGGNRGRTRAKLEQLRDLRNVIFHFKRGITVEEHETLAAGREWMLMRARAADARREEAKQ